MRCSGMRYYTIVMSAKLLTFCCAIVALCLFSEAMGVRIFKKPPGLPKPKTTSMTAAQQQTLLQNCIRRVVNRKEKTVQGKNFVICFRDIYMTSKIKPAMGSVLTSMNQCSRPGGINSKSPLYSSFENCVLYRGG